MLIIWVNFIACWLWYFDMWVFWALVILCCKANESVCSSTIDTNKYLRVDIGCFSRLIISVLILAYLCYYFSGNNLDVFLSFVDQAGLSELYAFKFACYTFIASAIDIPISISNIFCYYIYGLKACLKVYFLHSIVIQTL